VNETTVLVFPPSRTDGEATCALLREAGVECAVYYDTNEVTAAIDAGAGALILTDLTLSSVQVQALLETLKRQPPWSDLPVLLLCRSGAASHAVGHVIGQLTNVILLDRPASARALLSASQSALRARKRQYEIRDQLEALRRADEALRAADRRKDEFLAMLAHELRNPLAPILNATEVLAMLSSEQSGLRAPVNIVKRQTAHLTRLVDDLLDISRLTQGRIELQWQRLDLAEVLAQAIESVEPLMRERGHRVFVAAKPGIAYVDGDFARLLQCFSNVLTNAAKYTDPGGEIRVELRVGHDSRVIISDNGVGISPPLLPRVFDLFVQSDRSLDRSLGGLGIGLTVVKRLVEMHGGEVTAASRGDGQGSTFDIRLPKVPPPVEARLKGEGEPVRSQKILLVDDNADAAESLAMLLSMDGHHVETVYTAQDALSRVSCNGFEVILLDIGLPGMDGFALAERIRESGSDARLIALSGYGQTAHIERGRAAGFEAHLLKPADLELLRQTLRDPPDHRQGS
jgi:two-component system, sensor histidine kinase